MILLPIGVLWVGYTAVYYGMSLIRGEGLGLLDFVLPARAEKASQVLASHRTGFTVSGGGNWDGSRVR